MSLTSVKACIGRKIAALTLVCAVAVTSLPVTAYAAVSPSDINANAVSDSDAVQPKEDSSIPDKNADCPIIIVPGIMGSRLYQADERGRDDLVWAEGDMTKLSTYLWVLDALSLLPGKDTTLGEEIDISNELYVLHNSDKQNELPKYKREYGAADAYVNMVDTLCDEFGEERDIYFFSYDWRQSNVDSAQKLSEQIKNVLKGTEFDKVDLVCHSMGGGVASYYVSRYGESRIRKIITCGTPYEGAAAIFNRTLTNRILEIPVGDILISIAGLNTRRKVELPSISELLPSEAYFNADGTFCKGDKILGVFGLNKNSVEKINYEQYSEICRDIYGKNFDSAKSFYNSIRSGGFNVLANLDNSYFIIGTQQQTVNSVTFTSGLDIPGLNKNGVAVTDAQYGNGDGTVPYISATMLSRLKNKVGKDRYIELATNHGGAAGSTSNDMDNAALEGASKALTYITEILGDEPVTVESDKYQPQDSVVIRLNGQADVRVSRNGEVLDSSAENLNTLTSFGRIDFMGLTGEIKMLCLDSGNYNITVSGTADDTIEYTVRWFDANNDLTDERRFAAVPVTAATTISTNSVSSNDTVLNIDNDSDGTTDEKWSAAQNSDGMLTMGQNYTVTLSKSAVTLNQGELTRLKAEVSPSDWRKLQLAWSSSDPSVATVGSCGEIFAVGAGKAVITAKMPDGAQASCEITVNAVDKYNVTVSANEGGYVSTLGTTAVKSGRSMNILIMPNRGYYIKSITKNGEEITPRLCVSLKNIQQNHTVNVKFEKLTNITLSDIKNAFHGMK